MLVNEDILSPKEPTAWKIWKRQVKAQDERGAERPSVWHLTCDGRAHLEECARDTDHAKWISYLFRVCR